MNLEDIIMMVCIAGLSFQMGMLFESINSFKKRAEEFKDA